MPLLDTIASPIINSAMSSAGSAIGSRLGSLGSSLLGGVGQVYLQKWLNNDSVNNQKELMQYQLDMMPEEYNRLISLGLSPSAAAAAVADSPMSAPSASSGGSAPDVMRNSMESLMAPSQIRKNNASAQVDENTAPYVGPRQEAEIDNIIANTAKTNDDLKNNAVMRDYYFQLANATKQKLRYDLKIAAQTLSNMVAQFEQIKAQTRNIDANTELVGSQKFESDQRGFALMWDNSWRSLGVDPNQSALENVKRLAYFKPDQFTTIVGNFADSMDTAYKKIKNDSNPEGKNPLLNTLFHEPTLVNDLISPFNLLNPSRFFYYNYKMR